MSTKLRNNLIRIIASLVLFVAAVLLPLEGWPRFIAFMAVYLLIGWDILWRAVRNIFRGKIFDENFLMSVATVGAIALTDYPEAVAVMLFYQVGEWFQKYAVGKSRKSITGLMNIRPDYANLKAQDGSLQTVRPEEVSVGDFIVVKPGERVPLDGVVLEGASSLDTSALTGESAPRDILAGSEIFSGCINLTGTLLVEVKKEFSQSTVAKVLDLVQNSASKKAKTENFITRFARYYTPFVCLAALLLAIIPPLVTGQAFSIWIERALTFLVISCPCALVISVPLGFFGGIGASSKYGVLVKGSNYLEALAQTETVVFDKTGTLTKGSFVVSNIHPQEVSKEKLLELAAYVENYSDHPIAQSIKKAYGKEIDLSRISADEQVAGYGLKATVDGEVILAGNARMMEQNGIQYDSSALEGTVVHLATLKSYLGYVMVEDEVKPDSVKALQLLKAEGVKRTVMLTGDSDFAGKKAAKEIGIDEVYTKLLPADKVEKVETMFSQRTGKGAIAFVGDGINDAPVLARADVGIAMGGLGSDAAIEAADIVIMNDEPSRIAGVMRISKHTLRIVKQNIVFALAVKLIVLLLGALGFAAMWTAVFADVGVSVLAILNSMRILYSKPKL